MYLLLQLQSIRYTLSAYITILIITRRSHHLIYVESLDTTRMSCILHFLFFFIILKLPVLAAAPDRHTTIFHDVVLSFLQEVFILFFIIFWLQVPYLFLYTHVYISFLHASIWCLWDPYWISYNINTIHNILNNLTYLFLPITVLTFNILLSAFIITRFSFLSHSINLFIVISFFLNSLFYLSSLQLQTYGTFAP